MDDDATILTDRGSARRAPADPEQASAPDRTSAPGGAIADADGDDATVKVNPQSASVRHDLRPGAVINKRFVIEQVLGRGGMGVVYRAKDLRKEETGDRDPYVALKVLSDEFRLDPRMVVALQREARKAQTLAHPNIATVYDFDRDDDIVYLTME
jgi:serine/threonine protein kinase